MMKIWAFRMLSKAYADRGKKVHEIVVLGFFEFSILKLVSQTISVVVTQESLPNNIFISVQFINDSWWRWVL